MYLHVANCEDTIDKMDTKVGFIHIFPTIESFN